MKAVLELVVVVMLGVSVAQIALADSSDDEATITVVDEGSTPDDVVKVIELPDHASETAATKSASGLTTANSGKDRSGEANQNAGQQISDDAHNADISDQVRADAAQQARGEAHGDNGAGNRHAPPH